jgi:hypothetical protein
MKWDGNGVEAIKKELIKFDFFVDLKNPASSYFKKFAKIVDGMQGHEESIPVKGPLENIKLLYNLLKGRALSQFEYHLRKRFFAEGV